MKRNAIQVSLACFFGAAIGTILAMEISARFEYGQYFWALGALAGGLVAYVTYDFGHLCAGVKRSLVETKNSFLAKAKSIIGWRPDTLKKRAAMATFFGYGMLGFSLVSYGLLAAVSVATEINPISAPTIFVSIIFVFLGSMSLAIAIEPPKQYRPIIEPAEQLKERLGQDIKHGWQLVKFANPIIFPFTFVVLMSIIAVKFLADFTLEIAQGVRGHGPVLVKKAILLSWLSVKSLVKLVKMSFIYVHTEMRLLCLTDAALGAAIGYHFGSAIIGSIAGALLGLANYELVTVRWLKLAPAKSKDS